VHMRAITVAVVLCVLLTAVYRPVFFSNWDQRAKDLLTGWAGGGEPSNRVVIVAIDDRTLAQIGRWPWSRDRLSGLLQAILQTGPDTVVLDMIFPEADLAKPALPALPAAIEHWPGRDAASNDDLLAATLRNGRFVIGFEFHFSEEQADSPNCQLEPLRLTTVDTESIRGPALFSASGLSCSVEKLRQASLASGFLNAAPDRDGVLRRMPLLAEYRGNSYPSLALASYIIARHIHDVQLWTDSSGANSLRLDGVQIPVDSRADLLLRFRRPAGRFPSVSAADVMNGKAPRLALQGKIVVVGMSAAGLQDVVATADDPLLTGVEVQATAIDNLLQADPFRVPRGAFTGELALLLVMGLASALLIRRVGVAWAPLTVASLILLTWVGCAVAIRTSNIVVSPFPATIVLVGNLAALSLWSVTSETRREEQQLKIIRQFIMHFMTILTGKRDVETGAHIERVQRYARILCESMAVDPHFRLTLTTKTIQLICDFMAVHDIGKVAIPDRVLQYPGRLPPEEYEIIKSHVMQGYSVFAEAARSSGMRDETAIGVAKDIILGHHERWNGTGYPAGLAGENIPVAGRIAAVVDVYDAVACKRVYREAQGHEIAAKLIVSNRGILFDPAVVDAFVRNEKKIHAIQMNLADETAVTATT
jgi:HD-GYP domain-containing protein (c-di-GMP phosphodiesterase class II)